MVQAVADIKASVVGKAQDTSPEPPRNTAGPLEEDIGHIVKVLPKERGTAPTRWFEENFQDWFPESGKGRFVLQHHAFVPEELKDADYRRVVGTKGLGIHGDLRMDRGKGPEDERLLGFTIFLGNTDKLRQGRTEWGLKPDDALQGEWKAPEPLGWLEVGRPPESVEPGESGARGKTDVWGRFFAVDWGEFEVGVWREHSIEIFFGGKLLKGRYNLVYAPIGDGRKWLFKRPEDQKPQAEGLDLDAIVVELRGKGQRWLVIGSPGVRPEVVDTGKYEPAEKGGPGSGNWGHAGIPGQQGGSMPSVHLGGMAIKTEVIGVSRLRKVNDEVDGWGQGENRGAAYFALEGASQEKGILLTMHSSHGLEAISHSVERPEAIYVGALAVSPANIKGREGAIKGFGTTMMAQICKIASSRGKGVVTVPVESAEGFYRKLGMKQSGMFYAFTREEAKIFADSYFSSQIAKKEWDWETIINSEPTIGVFVAWQIDTGKYKPADETEKADAVQEWSCPSCGHRVWGVELGIEACPNCEAPVEEKGGPGSGNWGHEGVPGEQGGSAPGGGHETGRGIGLREEDALFTMSRLDSATPSARMIHVEDGSNREDGSGSGFKSDPRTNIEVPPDVREYAERRVREEFMPAVKESRELREAALRRTEPLSRDEEEAEYRQRRQLVTRIDELKSSIAEGIGARMALPKLQALADQKGYKAGWVWYQLKDKYGEKVANNVLSKEEKEISKFVPIAKVDEEKRLVTGPVLIPAPFVDAQGDEITAEEVERCALDWAMKSFALDLEHQRKLKPAEVQVVESWILKEAWKTEQMDYPVGSWMLTVKVHSDEVWKQVKSGELTGFSIKGVAYRKGQS